MTAKAKAALGLQAPRVGGSEIPQWRLRDPARGRQRTQVQVGPILARTGC
jgi:hypothetical protein